MSSNRYAFTGRTIEYHRAQIREALGFAEFTRADEDKMIAWLATEVCPTELNPDRQRAAIGARCWALRLEPPGRVDRILGATSSQADNDFTRATLAQLTDDVVANLGRACVAVPAPQVFDLVRGRPIKGVKALAVFTY